MSRIVRCGLPATPLIMTPALTAQGTGGAVVSGMTASAFLVAGALLLTLLLRRPAHALLHWMARRNGERRVEASLRQYGDLKSDFIVPGAYGGLARIDHALLTPRGLLCIRVVHRAGHIFGTPDDAQWTQVDGGRRRFLNPLIQNEGRRRALEKALAGIPVQSLVVFPGKVEFSDTAAANLVRLDDLDDCMKRYLFEPEKIDDPDAAWRRLDEVELSDDASRRDFEAQIGFG